MKRGRKELIMDRRQMLIGLGMTTLAVGCCKTEDDVVAAPSDETDAPEPVQYLFVQGAETASLADGVLRMGTVNAATIFFSDRPVRDAGHLPTEDLVANWGEGEDSFADDPPNATLSILSGPEPQEIVIVLTAPRLEDGDLVYDVEVLEGNETASGGACSLFIDVIGRPLTPMSVAGTTRRVARRTARRQ
jgi:hypothetical protein